MRRSRLRRKSALSQRSMSGGMRRGKLPRRASQMRKRSQAALDAHEQWLTIRAEVFERDGGVCQASQECSGATAAQVHHILPRSRGGGHGTDNLIALCALCHMWVHNNPEKAYERGLLTRTGRSIIGWYT